MFVQAEGEALIGVVCRYIHAYLPRYIRVRVWRAAAVAGVAVVLSSGALVGVMVVASRDEGGRLNASLDTSIRVPGHCGNSRRY